MLLTENTWHKKERDFIQTLISLQLNTYFFMYCCSLTGSLDTLKAVQSM